MNKDENVRNFKTGGYCPFCLKVGKNCMCTFGSIPEVASKAAIISQQGNAVTSKDEIMKKVEAEAERRWPLAPKDHPLKPYTDHVQRDKQKEFIENCKYVLQLQGEEHKVALEEIRDLLPEKPKLAITHQIKEIVDRALPQPPQSK